MTCRKFLCLWVLLMVSIAPFSAAEEPDSLVLSVTSSSDVGGLRVVDEQVISVRLTDSLWNLLADLDSLLPDAVDVDALSRTADGSLIVSTDVGFLHDGVPVADEDLLLLEDGTLTVLFDGSANGLPGAADVDAVHVVGVDPLEFYYSLATPAQVDGTVYEDDDIIHWASGSHSLVVSGSDLFGSRRNRLDVDGLWVDEEDGDLLLSTDVGFIDVDSVAQADDDDVLHLELATNTLSVFAEMSGHGVDSDRVDFDGLGDLGPFVFANGFESGDTGRWSISVP